MSAEPGMTHDCLHGPDHLLDEDLLQRKAGQSAAAFPSLWTGRCAACGATADVEYFNFPEPTWAARLDVPPQQTYSQVWLFQDIYGYTRYGLAATRAEGERIANRITELVSHLHEYEQAGVLVDSIEATGVPLEPGHEPLLFTTGNSRNLLPADDPRRLLVRDVEHVTDHGDLLTVTDNADKVLFG